MNNPSAVSLAPAFISAIVGFCSALLAILITPTLQHYLWKSQRREELRLATVKKLNELTSKFISDVISFEPSNEFPRFRPSQEFFHSFSVCANEIETLFSNETFQVFYKLENMIGATHSPGLLGPEGKQTIDDFIRAQKAALQALYDEVLPRRGHIQQLLWHAICPPQNTSKQASK